MFRSMRDQSRPIKDLLELAALLSRTQVGRFAFANEGWPYIVPMNLVYLEDSIYAHGADTGMKVEFLSANSKVCFECDEFNGTISGSAPCNHDTAYFSVIAFGEASIVTTPEERYKALFALTAKYAGEAIAEKLTSKMCEQYESGEGSKTAVYKLAISKMTGKRSA